MFEMARGSRQLWNQMPVHAANIAPMMADKEIKNTLQANNSACMLIIVIKYQFRKLHRAKASPYFVLGEELSGGVFDAQSSS